VGRRFPQARLIANTENLGFARANNQALRQSAAPFALLLNSDAALQPGALAALLACMEERLRAGIVGGTLLNPDGSFQASHGDFPRLFSQVLTFAGLARRVYGPHFPSHGPASSDEPIRADWVGGACLMARRAAFEQVGLLDDNYFMYGEETDWCYRMRQAGWEVISLPAARCLHWGGQSSRQVQSRTPARLAATVCLFFAKHYGRGYALLFRLSIVLVGAARTAIFGLLYLASLARRAEWKTKTAAGWRLAAAGLRSCAPSI